jgi:hypothetical protein
MGALLAAAIVLLNRLKIVLTQVLLLAGLTTRSPCDTISSIFGEAGSPFPAAWAEPCCTYSPSSWWELFGERSSRSPPPPPPPRHRPRRSPPRGCGGQNPAVHPLSRPCGSRMCHHPGSSRAFCKALMWCSLPSPTYCLDNTTYQYTGSTIYYSFIC